MPGAPAEEPRLCVDARPPDAAVPLRPRRGGIPRAGVSRRPVSSTGSARDPSGDVARDIRAPGGGVKRHRPQQPGKAISDPDLARRFERHRIPQPRAPRGRGDAAAPTRPRHNRPAPARLSAAYRRDPARAHRSAARNAPATDQMPAIAAVSGIATRAAAAAPVYAAAMISRHHSSRIWPRIGVVTVSRTRAIS